MQKQKLEVLLPREIARELESVFSTMPIVPRDCVKALNKLSFNMQRQELPPDTYKSIVFLILRGFTSKDQYLKSLIYALLENVSGRTGDGILGINSILKDVNEKSTTCTMRNSALRALFTNIPHTMQYDFEKYVQMAFVDDGSRDNAVCIASEYFHDMKIGPKITERIDDYHLSFFTKLPMNRYTSMVEIRRMRSDVGNLSQYLDAGVDSITFLEAARALAGARQELAAPLVEKAVSVLRVYLKRKPVEVFASMKVLNKLSVHFPGKVAKANREIGDLAQSTSKSVSMLAILTLLKTGTDETVKQLAAKLEPLMQTMSESYKMMAIDTMEKLSKGSKPEFISFLKNALLDRGEIGFKRFILRKLEALLRCKEHQRDITKFLCTYIEDPEFYQLSMDILGMLGCLENPRDLMHVYNRLILDNPHVRSCAFQTLFDLDGRFRTIESLRCTKDPETSRITSFLHSNSHLPRGPFELRELGDLRDEVLKYLPETLGGNEAEGRDSEDDFIKECRSIEVTPEDADFAIAVVKKVFRERIILEFTIENKMEKVTVASGAMTLASESGKLRIEVCGDDFKVSRKVVKEIEMELSVGNVFNGIFEYEICLQEDYEDAENDSISLIPFDINILDLVRPVHVEAAPTNTRSIELKFRARPTEAISKIVGISNMFLVADKDSFELSGTYEDYPVVIRGEAKFVKYTVVEMQIMCDSNSVIDQISSVFD